MSHLDGRAIVVAELETHQAAVAPSASRSLRTIAGGAPAGGEDHAGRGAPRSVHLHHRLGHGLHRGREFSRRLARGESVEDGMPCPRACLRHGVGGFADSALKGVVSVPMPSTSTVTTSPGLRNTCRSMPVPAGVPVMMTSPG